MAARCAPEPSLLPPAPATDCAHGQDACAEGLEAAVVLTEPFQLSRSNAAEVERIPRQHHRAAGQILGQIDIDSDIPNVFTAADEALLNRMADLLADTLG